MMYTPSEEMLQATDIEVVAVLFHDTWVKSEAGQVTDENGQPVSQKELDDFITERVSLMLGELIEWHEPKTDEDEENTDSWAREFIWALEMFEQV